MAKTLGTRIPFSMSDSCSRFWQPILRAAGRKVVLENLTQAERDFLASIRQMVYFQQGFYTQIVTGTGSQAAPSGGISISLPSLGGGYYGLLAHQIRIQNTRQNIIGLEENLRRLEELFAANQIEDVFQVEQTRQGLFDSESLLLTQIKSYQDNVETYLRSLGLPPDLKVEINDPVMEQFQLMSPTITVLQEDIGLLLSDMRKKDQPLPNDFPVRIENIIKRTQSEINILDNDLVTLEKAVPERVAGLRALEAGLAEQIRQGERIESAIYDADIFAKRIQTLREVEVPANYARLEAVFYLLQWTLATGESELRPMIEADTFPDTLPADVLKAMRVLRLIDDGNADIQTAQVDMAAKQEEIRKAQQELESLKKLVENERQTQAESSVSFDVADSISTALTAPALTPKGTNTVVVAEKTSGEPTNAQQMDAKQIIEELRQEDKYRDWLHDLLTEFQNEVATLSIAQVKTRLDAVNLLPTSLSETDALKMAEENRLDWMNRRAALVDSWRQIEIAANKLKGDLNVRVEGEIGTIDQRGVRFDNDDSRLRVGLEWDSPLTRHTEMMDYRRSQIAYQAARRDYYTYVDSVDAELRNLLRELRLTQVDFEIRRNAILIAAKQVDVAQLNLIKPAERGTPIDSNTATRVIDSLARMSSTQNSFIDAWVNYQTSRMLLDMSLGTMELDKQGRWIDPGQITKDRLGPVARHGGKNAVPGGTHGNSRGLTPSKRKHQQRRGAKNLIEAAPHEIPPAPRLETETKNAEPTLAPDENVAGILEVNAETESEVAAEQIVAEIVPMESAPPAPKTASNKALKPSMPKPVLRLTPCEAVTMPDTVPNNNGPDKMSDTVNTASSEKVNAQIAGTRPHFRPAPLPPQRPE